MRDTKDFIEEQISLFCVASDLYICFTVKNSKQCLRSEFSHPVQMYYALEKHA